MKRFGICALLLVLATAGIAQAAELATMREGHWDFSVQTRYTPSQDFENEGGATLHLSDDLGWGFGFGYNVSDQFNLGFAWNWRGLNYSATVARDDAAFDSYSNWLDTSTLALQGEYSLLRTKFSPYVNGSLGWTFIDSNIVSDYYGGGCYWDPWYGYICYDSYDTYSTEAFVYSVGAGMRMELTPTVFIRIGYEHGWMDMESVDGIDMFRVDLGSLF
jgi:opacity protein-like surface antigen